MQDTFRIGDVEYTIHHGRCHSGDNILCTRWPQANEAVIKDWLQHHRAGAVLKRIAGRIRPVNGACNDTIVRQLSLAAATFDLSITKRIVEPKEEELPAAVIVKAKEAYRKRTWWEDGSRPLGPGFWELVPAKPVDEKGFKLALEIAGNSRVSLNESSAVRSWAIISLRSRSSAGSERAGAAASSGASAAP